MKFKSVDYENYGEYKTFNTSSDHVKKLARKIGIKNRFIKFVDKEKRDELLIDLGCGDGEFLNELKNSGFIKLMGVEVSPSYDNKYPYLDIKIDDAENFLKSIDENSVGTILAFDVFEHIPISSLNNLFGLIHNVLNENGKVIFRVPNMGSPLGLINYFGDITHVTPLNLSSVDHLAWSNNFVVLSVEAEPFSYPRSIFDVIGMFFYGIVKIIYKLIMRSFGVKKIIFSPNIICTFSKKV